MPIVVVHGVSTRNTDADYEARQVLMSLLIRRHLSGATLNGRNLQDSEPVFPYWGNLATTFAWDMASLPSDRVDVLGGSIDNDIRPLVAMVRDELGELGIAGGEPMLAMARRALPQAVCLLSELLLQDSVHGNAHAIARWVLAAQEYAEANSHPAWLAKLSTDEQLINCLSAELNTLSTKGVEALGVAESVLDALTRATLTLKVGVKAAVTSAINRSGDFACTKLLAWQRRRLNGIVGRFLGDVFVYLDSRGDRERPGPIPSAVLQALREARRADEPLIVIAHSLGGVIAFDVLSVFGSDLEVDLFVTVGSQVSHFEEMKRLKNSDTEIPTAAIPRATTPSNIRYWINAFDEVDIFAYECGRVFDRVLDFQYDTHTPTIAAHSAYLEQTRFYERLRKRIDTLQ